MSFSPHTDAKGIMDLVKFLSPKHVILVHGEKPKMALLKGRIQSELGIKCYDPANNVTVQVPSMQTVEVEATKMFVKENLFQTPSWTNPYLDQSYELNSGGTYASCTKKSAKVRVTEGVLVMEKSKRAKVVYEDELYPELALEGHRIDLAYCFPISIGDLKTHEIVNQIKSSNNCSLLKMIFLKLRSEFDNTEDCADHLKVHSVEVRICADNDCPYRLQKGVESDSVQFCCKWSVVDDRIARRIISILSDM